MEGVHVVGVAGPEGLKTEVPQWGPGASSGEGLGDEVPQKLK